ncbi:FixH family protein [Stieleria sp. TO1_6]|uniref:FixH family protein n=1 Tax=Stieleria tagensis TaxID=2956795 RepID=UPI00209BA64D|nr:FixH family protein [Stieleria tagensis]MCO8121898.1 FixH family protein [Stieleria tagensis]
MNTTPRVTDAAERKAKRFWIALVLFLFTIQCTIMGMVMHFAIGDPAGAVVPDYHNASLHWDETRRTREAAERLGWDIQFNASDVVDRRGMRAIELTIQDTGGQPVDGLSIHGQLYHHAHADQIQPVTFQAAGQGRYLALPQAARPGLWQLEVAIDNAPEAVTRSITFNTEGF